MLMLIVVMSAWLWSISRFRAERVRISVAVQTDYQPKLEQQEEEKEECANSSDSPCLQQSQWPAKEHAGLHSSSRVDLDDILVPRTSAIYDTPQATNSLQSEILG